MILHFVNDEKIINRTIDMFEHALPQEHLWVVANRKHSFKIVEKRKNIIGRDEFLQKKGSFKISAVFIHLLNERKIELCRALPKGDYKVYWIVWGLDLYNNLLLPKGFEMIPKSSSFFTQSPVKKKIFRAFSDLFASMKAQRIVRFIEKNVDFIVTDTTENDYDQLLKYYPQLSVKVWKDFFYYPIDVVLGKELLKSHTSGNDIMIGNSASSTNNHEYAFSFLSHLSIGERKVIVPLSYSGKKYYVEAIKREGGRIFGEHFRPLTDFMPLDDYNELQKSVSVGIFASWRQESIGNVLILLYLGARVFLSSRNPVYQWALSHNLHVDSLEDISQKLIDTPLGENQREENRKILIDLYNKDRLFSLIKEL